mmetsp:Transcript_14637/g.35304  ORF Transcript_14637/g.35304 Transcript_14637/m.35304 type:complete len:494 (-) Transcript_14637:67-1548(-)
MPIAANKLYPEQGSGLAFRKKEDMLFVSGISLDSIFADTELEFGDRIVAVMDVNFMNYADEKYAKTLLKRAKREVNIVVEKGWDKLQKGERDKYHGIPRQESMIIPKKKGKITITKNTAAKDAPPPMERLEEAETEGIANKDVAPPPPVPEEESEGTLVFSPEVTTSRKTSKPEKEEESPPSPAKASTPEPSSPVTDDTTENESPSTSPANGDKPRTFLPPVSKHRHKRQKDDDGAGDTSRTTKTPEKEESSSPEKAFTSESPSPLKFDTPEKESPSPRHSFTPESPVKSFTPDKAGSSPANNGKKPRKFLPPVSKEKKKRHSKTDVNAGTVVTRMLDKLDNERKGIKERHRIRLNQSFDDSVGDNQETKTPEKRTVRKYSSPSSIGYPNPTSNGFKKNMRKHQGGYLCISVRKMSERNPGIKLRRKDSMFILDRLPHDENRIPVGLQVLAINGNDSFTTVVKANELIDSKKQEVELCVSFEGLIAVRPSDDQ